jgi:hypothetical protein
MKSIRAILPGTIAIGFLATSMLAAIPDVDIHAVAKRIDATAPRNEGNETRAVWEEHWNYEVTLENKRFQPLTGLEVRYMIFYKTEKLGSTALAQEQHQSGTYSLDTLNPHQRMSFTTNSVELKKSHLNGNWRFRSGGRSKAEEALVGICVRVYRAGQLVGEFADPSALAKDWQ